MIPDNSTFYNQSQYFDNEGHVHNIEVGSTKELNPQPVGFLRKDRGVQQLYLANNPWRATNKDAHSRIYQYCVFCNAKRFEDETFHGTKEAFQGLMDTKIRPGLGEGLSQCRELKCQGGIFNLEDNLPNTAFKSIFDICNTDQLPTTIAGEQLKMLSQKYNPNLGYLSPKLKGGYGA